jgi:pimeloyl-ACP methyl ester carboxylesterase
LVHGYCSNQNPFPIGQFADAVEFLNPGARRALGDSGGGNNWSIDQFAQKIHAFAVANNIDGCGTIAHSQGGMASLHLYANYWSCLDYADNASGSRLIQSLGTPYLGTPLSGMAALGELFGAGCGSNYDLTTDGASAWLDGISTVARSKVTYFTTEMGDTGWWTNDYCNFATDLILSDPEDGTTEKHRAQLSGGNNGGHKTEWCHTSGMAWPHQALDSSRNSDMSANAQY